MTDALPEPPTPLVLHSVFKYCLYIVSSIGIQKGKQKFYLFSIAHLLHEVLH